MDVAQGGVSRQMVYNMDIRESHTHSLQLFWVVGLGGLDTIKKTGVRCNNFLGWHFRYIGKTGSRLAGLPLGGGVRQDV
jgi:hypothetical protein